MQLNEDTLRKANRKIYGFGICSGVPRARKLPGAQMLNVSCHFGAPIQVQHDEESKRALEERALYSTTCLNFDLFRGKWICFLHDINPKVIRDSENLSPIIPNATPLIDFGAGGPEPGGRKPGWSVSTFENSPDVMPDGATFRNDVVGDRGF